MKVRYQAGIVTLMARYSDPTGSEFQRRVEAARHRWLDRPGYIGLPHAKGSPSTRPRASQHHISIFASPSPPSLTAATTAAAHRLRRRH